MDVTARHGNAHYFYTGTHGLDHSSVSCTGSSTFYLTRYIMFFCDCHAFFEEGTVIDAAGVHQNESRTFALVYNLIQFAYAVNVSSGGAFYNDRNVRLYAVCSVVSTGFAAFLANGEASSEVIFSFLLQQLDDADAVIGFKSHGVEKLEDLKGKKVAYAPGTSSEEILNLALESVGLTLADIEGYSMEPANMVTAAISGSVDAIAAWSPFTLTILEEVGEDAIKFCSNADFTDKAVALASWVCNPKYAEENPDILVRFTRALFKGMDFGSDPANYETIAQYVAAQCKTDFEIAYQQRGDAKWLSQAEVLESIDNGAMKGYYQLQQDAFVASGAINAGEILTVDEFVMYDVMTAAATAPAAPAASETLEPLTLNVAYMPNWGSLWAVATADGKGYFAEEGITINLTQFEDGPSEIAAMKQGSMDVAFIGPGAHKLCSKGDAQVFLMQHMGDGDCILGLNGLKTLEELAGKKVGYAAGTSSETILTTALASVGLTMDDIEAYYEALAALYGPIPVLSVIPLWRGDNMEGVPTLEAFCAKLKKICEKYSNITIVEGWELIPHLPEYFLDNLHPNQLGCEVYGRNLVEAIRKSGF